MIHPKLAYPLFLLVIIDIFPYHQSLPITDISQAVKRQSSDSI